MTLRKLLGPGEPWRLVEHFMMTSVICAVVLGGLGVVVATGSPPTHTVVSPGHKSPHEIVLDPITSYPLAPIPMQGD
jgi:hypothetical protein